MKEESLRKIADILAAVAVVVLAAAVVAVAVVAAVVAVVVVAVVVLAAAVVAVAVVAVVALGIENPKISIMVSSCLIGICMASLFFTLPVALNPPHTIQVVCQTVHTNTQIFIHSNITETITQIQTSNETLTQVVNQVHCP